MKLKETTPKFFILFKNSFHFVTQKRIRKWFRRNANVAGHHRNSSNSTHNPQNALLTSNRAVQEQENIIHSCITSCRSWNSCSRPSSCPWETPGRPSAHKTHLSTSHCATRSTHRILHWCSNESNTSHGSLTFAAQFTSHVGIMPPGLSK